MESTQKDKSVSKQRELPEAVASGTLSIVTPKGFNTLLTLRDVSIDDLVDNILKLEVILEEKGFKPQAVRSFAPKGGFPPKAPKQIEYVEGRVCPTCKAKLIYFEAKGKKHIKCSTSKYDWKTKTSLGCGFLEWAKDENQEKINSFDQENQQ